jgi:ribosomal protein S18 acetylase RimI-like enzyme
VRPARPADVPAIERIVHDAYLHYVERIGRPPAPMSVDYEQTVRSGSTWVASVDQEVAGVLVLVAAPSHLLIENVAVDPDRQRAGIGTALLHHAELEARRQALTELRLYTNEAMTENLAYYPRRGYQQTHREDDAGFTRVYFSRAVPDA